MISDYLKLSFNNLRQRGLRSWLTMLGIFIGIAAVVSLISLGQGLQDSVNQQFQTLGADKITVMAGSGFSGPPGSGFSSSKLTDHDISLIKKVSGVKNVATMSFKQGKVEYRNEIKYTYIYGLPLEPDLKEIVQSISAVKVVDGRELKSGDKGVIIITQNIANGKFFDKSVKVRDTITIEDKDFKVLGIVGPIGNPIDDSSIWISLDDYNELFNEKDNIGMIIVQTEQSANVTGVAANIERSMRRDRNLKEGEENFRVSTSEQLAQSFSNVFGIIQTVLIGIAAISLVVGGIGIMNTMYTSVLERTREIGIMKAIGARNSDILMIFLIESGLLGLAGGLIGIGIGIGLSKSVEFIGASVLGTNLLRASFSPTLIIGALLFSFIVGSLSGVLPAIQASRLKPVDALRYE
ncbi:MAG: ABC transporter permease [Nanoarchaeota archaeon]|nr:ABC transporter permease [Nanoarchaeota archaeon]MBU0962826.1 ABC transporter permease [Nanoarchaeota archaeon]